MTTPPDRLDALEQVAEYAKHREGCHANYPRGGACTCGLDALRAQMGRTEAL